MNVTNDERREVAARLRLLPDQRGIYSDRQFFELLDEKIFCLLDKALDNPRGFHTWVSNIFYLADLIEPEPEQTCQIVQNRCTNCDHEINERAYFEKVALDDGCWTAESRTANYCPNCGARVKEDADAN